MSWIVESYGWVSTEAALCGLITVVFTVTSCGGSRGAPEPIVPLRLFRIDVVYIAVPMAVLASAVMYGCNVFLPLFLQGVTGVSPTNSGLLLVPMAVGVSGAATYSGRRIAKTGRYKIWPIIGSIGLTISTTMFVPLQGSTSWLILALPAMLLFGMSIGLTTPPTDARRAERGGASRHRRRLVADHVHAHARRRDRPCRVRRRSSRTSSTRPCRSALVQRAAAIHDLPPAQRDAALAGLTHAITTVFAWGVPVVAAATVLAFLLPERPLRTDSAMGPNTSAAAH